MPNVTPEGQAGAARLKLYWSTGRGKAQWIGSPHPYATLVDLLRRFVSERQVHGLAANIFREATGEFPGQRKAGQRL